MRDLVSSGFKVRITRRELTGGSSRGRLDGWTGESLGDCVAELNLRLADEHRNFEINIRTTPIDFEGQKSEILFSITIFRIRLVLLIVT